MKQYSRDFLMLGLTLLLGFVAYGLNIYFYILAQRDLGAARTSAYYAIAPFVGVLLSVIIFGKN
jgi:drug/metabolite transporter (DMT)-like permease